MSENNDTSNESNSLGSDSILQASRLTGGGVNPVLRSGVLRPSVLGPSVLGSALNNAASSSNNANSNSNTNANSNATDGHKPKDEVSSTTSNNPFMREQKDDDDEEEANDCEAGAVGGEAEAKAKEKDDNAEDGKKGDDDEEPDERPDPLSLLRKNGLERANLFAAAKNSIPLVEKSGFVFGQNVHERVVGENINPENSSKSDNSDGGSTTGELLFSSVIQNAAKSNDSDKGATTKEAETKTLTDVAREYEESRAQKRKFEEVETFTGEENEINIIDVSCKLFAFVNSNWEERGRGSLRLNDSKNEQECSRVVFRTSGNLRLLLNTKVWAGMVAQRPSNKSLRLTAMDNTGKIKIFLVMGRPGDMAPLHKELVERIELRKVSHPEECRAANSENNGTEAKNGVASIASDEAEAAATAEPEHDECPEPSPKKSLFADARN